MARLYIAPRIIFGGAMRIKPQYVMTLSGKIIKIVPEDGEIYLELPGVFYPSAAVRPRIVATDIVTQNGVVHTLNNLLIPTPGSLQPNSVPNEQRPPDSRPKPEEEQKPEQPAPTEKPKSGQHMPNEKESQQTTSEIEEPTEPGLTIEQTVPESKMKEKDKEKLHEKEKGSQQTTSEIDEEPTESGLTIGQTMPDSKMKEKDKDRSQEKESEKTKPRPGAGKAKGAADDKGGNVIPASGSNGSNEGDAENVPVSPTKPSENKIEGPSGSSNRIPGLEESGDPGSQQLVTEKSPGVTPTKSVDSNKIQTITDQLSKHGSTLFLDILTRYSEIYAVLSSEGPKHTVFAPTDDAFLKIPRSIQKKLRSNPEFVKKVLLLHIAKNVVNISRIKRYKEIPLLAKDKLIIRKFGKKIMVDKALINPTPIKALNGIVYSIDCMLVPTSDDMNGVLDHLGLLTFKAGIRKSGLENRLSKTNSIPFIIWAPTDEAFKKLPADALAYLLANKEVMRKVIRYHITPGFFYTNLMTKAWVYVFKSHCGQKVRARKFGPKPEQLFVMNPRGPNAKGVNLNVRATNGIIHVIDQVLIPKGLNISSLEEKESRKLKIKNGEKVVDKKKRKRL